MLGTAILWGICWFVGLLQLTHALTSIEANLFDSEEIPVIIGQPNLVGRVGVGSSGINHILMSNGIPDNAAGTFPNENNPYPITEQDFLVSFPKIPVFNNESQCLPANSIIGFAVNGVALYSPFDEDKNDLNGVDFGVNCQGRTAEGGIYYFAQVPDRCSTFQRLNSDQIFGVAIDGFPIYGPGEGKNKITNADLDVCHGKMVDGQYRYYMTDEWPYILGCFRGTPMTVSNNRVDITPSNICKFACNKDAMSNDVTCVDDFQVTTQAPTTTSEGSIANTSVPFICIFTIVSFGLFRLL